jgi:hypothetical protein
VGTEDALPAGLWWKRRSDKAKPDPTGFYVFVADAQQPAPSLKESEEHVTIDNALAAKMEAAAEEEDKS